MYTSDIDDVLQSVFSEDFSKESPESSSDVLQEKSSGSPFLKTALAFLLFSMFCALFGAVYEVFSHSVYSYYMIYAFAFPLAGGTFPYLVLGLRTKLAHAPGRAARNLWNSGIVTFAVGSILQGILEIYGTTNRLMIVYLVAGTVLVLAGIGTWVYDMVIKMSEGGVRSNGS